MLLKSAGHGLGASLLGGDAPSDGKDDGTEARELLQTIVQFGGADVLLSTLSLLPDADPPAAVLALLNDSMYIRASSEPASPFPLTHHSASGLLKQQVSPAHTRCPRH